MSGSIPVNSSRPSPAAVVLLSGKRKSGKDFIADRLAERLAPRRVFVVRLSAPLKRQYALENGLDFKRLLDSSGYKELHRKAMVVWGEKKRDCDRGFFCRAAIDDALLGVDDEVVGESVWIVPDARRLSDLQFFRNFFSDCLMTVRVRASEETRRGRGWAWSAGVDDAETECGLDAVSEWDVVVDNEGVDGELEELFRTLEYAFVKHSP